MVEALNIEFVSIKENKVDLDAYEEAQRKLQNDVEANKYASEDNFRNLLGTDNYIEKYLPFTIQAMISETVGSFTSKREQDRLREYEGAKYKELHRLVLADQGIPNLPKKTYNRESFIQHLNNRQEAKSMII
mmetsp:Transcript_35954/g.34973  ORF Transcript_35954/g.34973 Transcript_35954/m.34973 type:complete len:132 (+) Transcript_35954:578-973(+)|eukprot:CAMPEP_0170560012 /NCGR_PEP_ID=MMETSP0211-20121228/46406_1 /TAXON_ID=311385 /ORGANISM="Pseudokeronopsis sp., Strain OXSARD2" /LENGTH=131 /DNA_ID=CAMNT_0010873711 /DNA_START=552 /DNA_END=947 /DNA_ORIENTATION=+